ncbi:membrane protein [Streptococcus porcinus]|uniref:EbsA family protein n=1 Tax=Streptococcus porcinus TaxID=1340 RepID=A0A4U9YVQ1_STRPO|nr:EbsA family protein [Streptococcus porcinus]MBA2795017.1 EbsA family protein [Streptococcus porcinus]VTS31453.1 membrane protein [Streptococcus porcinus]
MIKIFGKIRYHWQPELSWSIIYWSIAISPIFIGLSLLYENTNIPRRVFVLFFIFIVLVGIGLHRYFLIEEGGILKIVSLRFLGPQKLAIADITKVEVTKSTVTICTSDKNYLFYMRKWPKKYFLDALVINPYFKGEVVLVDNLINLDYFEYYKNEKKTLTLL